MSLMWASGDKCPFSAGRRGRRRRHLSAALNGCVGFKEGSGGDGGRQALRVGGQAEPQEEPFVVRPRDETKSETHRPDGSAGHGRRHSGQRHDGSFLLSRCLTVGSVVFVLGS